MLASHTPLGICSAPRPRGSEGVWGRGQVRRSAGKRRGKFEAPAPRGLGLGRPPGTHAGSRSSVSGGLALWVAQILNEDPKKLCRSCFARAYGLNPVLRVRAVAVSAPASGSSSPSPLGTRDPRHPPKSIPHTYRKTMRAPECRSARARGKKGRA